MKKSNSYGIKEQNAGYQRLETGGKGKSLMDRQEVSKEEVDEDGKVYLLKEDDGSLRLVVFGDENSKRSVSNVVKMVVE